MKVVRFLAVAAIIGGASLCAANFTQCPAVGADTNGCELLITVTAASGGAATAFTVTTAIPDQGPYDAVEDTLVGVANSSGSTVTSLALSSTASLFGFDGDGACTFISCPGATDTSGYGPAGVTFSGINGAGTAGVVNFSPGVADGGTSWFSLEEALTASQILPGNPSPEPSSIAMMGVGLIAGVLAVRRRRTAR